MSGSSRGLESGRTKKGEIDHIATIHGPWSKGNYSRYIREASMAMDGLPEGVASPGRVPEQLLQTAPILKRRRRNRGEIAKKEFILGVSVTGGKYRRRGRPGDPPGSQEASWRGLGGARPWALPGPRVVAPFAALVFPEASATLIFYLIFLDFLEHF